MPRLTRLTVAAGVLAMLGTGAASCGDAGSQARPAPGRPSSTAIPTPAASTPTRQPGQPVNLRAAPMTGPTNLRLLVERSLLDADSDTQTVAGITTWLRASDGPTIFVEEIPSTGEFDTVRVRAIPSPPKPITTALRVTKPPNARLAAAADGRGVWVAEYRNRTRCTVRQVWLDGRTRRPPRDVPCGTDLLAETSAGLWVSRWVNAYSLAGREVTSSRMRDETTFALLGPDTMRERARYPEARVIGSAHVLTMDDTEQNLVLHNLRTGGSVAVTKPTTISFWGFGTKLVSTVSPDGRYALFRFGEHSTSPQTLDVWVLDLVTARWLELPGMPVHAALKYCYEDWSADGRLMLVGDFPGMGQILATWRPGDPELTARAFTLPPGTYDSGLGAAYFW